MEIANEQILETVKGIFLGSVQTVDIIQKYFDDRLNIHSSGEIIAIKQQLPWK